MAMFGSSWLEDSDDGAMVPSSWKEEMLEDDGPIVPSSWKKDDKAPSDMQERCLELRRRTGMGLLSAKSV